ncbi:MAG: transcription antitermination protein NusB [Crocinitomicaceae bacterium]|nr:transcription antitermination protein NusB [Crocinitomicaceae bacterium]
MLNRRHLRIKVLQMLYSYFNDEDPTDIHLAEKNLLNSIERIYDLYIYFLLSFPVVREVALNKQDERKKKLRPTKEDLYPNLKFVDNKIISLIINSVELNQLSEKRKINWDNDEKREMYRKIFIEIEKSEVYFEHMNNDENGFEACRNFLIQLFKEEIANSPIIYDFFEDEDIHWMDDIDLACSMVIKTIKKTKEDKFEILPLYKANDDEKEFICTLFNETIKKDAENELMIENLVENWEFERIAKMDVLLLKMAITELQCFESIPTKVSINEYIEISKYYSTPKSNVFINGILDKSVNLLSKENKIIKSGRGLIQ